MRLKMERDKCGGGGGGRCRRSRDPSGCGGPRASRERARRSLHPTPPEVMQAPAAHRPTGRGSAICPLPPRRAGGCRHRAVFPFPMMTVPHWMDFRSSPGRSSRVPRDTWGAMRCPRGRLERSPPTPRSRRATPATGSHDWTSGTPFSTRPHVTLPVPTASGVRTPDVDRPGRHRHRRPALLTGGAHRTAARLFVANGSGRRLPADGVRSNIILDESRARRRSRRSPSHSASPTVLNSLARRGGRPRRGLCTGRVDMGDSAASASTSVVVTRPGTRVQVRCTRHTLSAARPVDVNSRGDADLRRRTGHDARALRICPCTAPPWLAPAPTRGDRAGTTANLRTRPSAATRRDHRCGSRPPARLVGCQPLASKSLIRLMSGKRLPPKQ